MKPKGIVRKKRETRYILYSGKGGVGKTSLAAATALHLSKNGEKVLVISTDPAHSLSDSFEKDIGGEMKKLNKNLYAVEIDPKKAVREYKEKFMPKIEKIEMLQELALGEAFDMVGMTPGIDEIAAFDKFLDYIQSKEYDAIIFDTAPTGHTLRFLSLPDVLDSWVGKVITFRVVLSDITNTFKKFLPFIGSDSSEAGVKQLEASKARMGEAKSILSNPKKTQYNIVMIPEEMCILESQRSLETLKQFGIQVNSIIINKIIPKNIHCLFCAEKRKQQLKRIKTIKQRFKKFKITQTSLFKHEVKGLKMLEKLGKEIFPK